MALSISCTAQYCGYGSRGVRVRVNTRAFYRAPQNKTAGPPRPLQYETQGF